MAKVRSAFRIAANTTTWRGMVTLVRIEPRARREPTPFDEPSEKKFQSTIPTSRKPG